ncbi:50S ribosomal protein L23 [Lactovum miscens]|uniref:Large ribosomal subunit protein uL23 n=1 Tax=Lactovum miscens TaxID=190387 RepID=A0A841C9V2_9LACT|nr:50S ribosomal protein L23 [Lactovum miscens]MBB5888498.1 large subunit ribosomal protein L23 [Lactovum miscens]
MANLYDIIRKPIITEKSMMAMDQKKYTFEVAPKSSKGLIKQAVEAVFGVKVVSVQTISVKQKAKRVGRYSGFKSGYKKAIVTLSADSKAIDVFGEDAE